MFLARNKKTGFTTEVTAAQRENILSNACTEGKYSFTEIQKLDAEKVGSKTKKKVVGRNADGSFKYEEEKPKASKSKK